jgi:NADP-dependent 3-hydroxy acid dehydrogenase YdfG
LYNLVIEQLQHIFKKDKTILITGASSGIGKETAKLFQSKGWNVIATMRNPANETELNQLENVLVTQLDVLDVASIQEAFNEGVQNLVVLTYC